MGGAAVRTRGSRREVSMNVAIIVESLWGNTRAVAEAVAEGLREVDPDARVTVGGTDDTPAAPEDVDLLLLGGPTHAFGMSREGTRTDAERRGSGEAPSHGVREWIAAAPPHAGVRVVTFDTRVKGFPGSAAGSAAKALRKRGWDAEGGESFFVGGYEGPLGEGELDRARAWGTSLARRAGR